MLSAVSSGKVGDFFCLKIGNPVILVFYGCLLAVSRIEVFVFSTMMWFVVSVFGYVVELRSDS